MSLKKVDSKLADKDGNPLIGEAQDAIAEVADAGVDSINLIATVNAIIAALEAHGLVKAS